MSGTESVTVCVANAAVDATARIAARTALPRAFKVVSFQ
jgi:hypothetical protein